MAEAAMVAITHPLANEVQDSSRKLVYKLEDTVDKLENRIEDLWGKLQDNEISDLTQIKDILSSFSWLAKRQDATEDRLAELESKVQTIALEVYCD